VVETRGIANLVATAALMALLCILGAKSVLATDPALTQHGATEAATPSNDISPTACSGAKTVQVAPPTAPYITWSPGAHPPGTIFDMQGDTFVLRISSNPDPDGPCRYVTDDQLPTIRYPIVNPRDLAHGTLNACFRGGRVIGDISLTGDLQVWASNGGYCNSAAIEMKNAASTNQKIEAIRVDRAWDAFRVGGASCARIPGSCHNLIQGVWASNVRDDCVEDDTLGGLVVKDSLFDGCFSGVSADPGGCTKCPASHQDTDTIMLDGVLLRLQGFPYTYMGKFTMHHVGPFKIHGSLGPRLVVNDSVIAFEYYDPTRYDRWSTGWKKIKSCRNNQLLWLPDAPFPPSPNFPMPPGCFTIRTGAAARAVWNEARSAWIAQHPDIARIGTDPGAGP
jgi:hypothetical protein